MHIEKFKHKNVQPDGTVKGHDLPVCTTGAISIQQKDGGCGHEGCNCANDLRITIVAPRTEKGVVEGMTVYFDDKKEMQKFFNEGELSL